MTATKSLLVELFVEELPPKALKKLGESFAATLADGLKAHGLTTEHHSVVTSFASPRRLAAHISAVRVQADDKALLHKLMPVSVGLNAEGQATPALLKKLASVGADASVLPRLRRQMDGKAEALFFDSMVKGATLTQGLQKALDEALAKLPIPKVMQYQLADGWTSVNFVRPAHGLVALHGPDVIAVTALGLTAGRNTGGHRFEAAIDPVVLRDADHYARQLKEQGAVVASFAERHGDIARQLQAAAAKEGLTPIDDAALLDEVTALVERPNVLLCRFEPEFLEVPQECLILTMKANQKYFPLLDAAGKLTSKFLIVSNVSPADPRRVIEGNERVVRPRLADAKFFFDQDRKRTLLSRVPGLSKVVYHGKLGTQGERVERVRLIARALAEPLGGTSVVASADTAAHLAKADLLTDMVGEFPELQGVMGAYYARHDGLSDEIAAAIEDHYKPRFAGDELPRNPTGVVVALADKLETLVGLFGIGQVPSGDKDPFALRRHALGCLRIVIERSLRLTISELIARGLQGFVDTAIALNPQVLHAFFSERLANLLRDKGHAASEIDAVLSLGDIVLPSITRRLDAVKAFAELPESQSLAAANKRIGNILKKSTGAAARVDEALFREPEERALFTALVETRGQAGTAFESGLYAESLRFWAGVKDPVYAFFDKVLVNDEDARIRANRLALLQTMHTAMNRVADLSKLAT
ncbi:MAG TPA: glycine--tRNA ligase subunit beta [Rhizobacter sp.]|nr:glycine--tRNA ligase subunit beta [Rhizobacter sp.]